MPNPNPQPTSPANQAAAILNNANRQAAQAKIARTALALRQLATAAAALRQVPGGGAAADTLLKVLDTAINKGGRIYTKNGKLARTTPPPQVGWAFLLSVAPWAMRGIAPAVSAARVGLARFGPALAANLGTGLRFVGPKVATLLDKAKGLPLVGTAASLAKKALLAASVLLGIQAVAKVVAPDTAKMVDAAAARAVQAVRKKGGQYGRATAKAIESTAQAVVDLPAKAAESLTSGVKWAAAAAAAAFILPKLLGR